MAQLVDTESEEVVHIDLSEIVFEKVLDQITSDLGEDDLEVSDMTVDSDGDATIVVTVTFEAEIELDADDLLALVDEQVDEDAIVREFAPGEDANSFSVKVTYMEAN